MTLELEERIDKHSSAYNLDHTVDLISVGRDFREIKEYPLLLVTHNTPSLKRLFDQVTRTVWHERITDMELALQEQMASDYYYRILLRKLDSTGDPSLDRILNNAFMEKFEEIRLRVDNDFKGFFPYSIDHYDHRVMVFKKLEHLPLVKYVAHRARHNT